MRVVVVNPNVPSSTQPATAAPSAAPNVLMPYSRPTTRPASATLDVTARATSGNESPMSVVGTRRIATLNANDAVVLCRLGASSRYRS